MALESATHIHQLVESNPTTNDPIRQGDDHIRLIKAALKATFPNITGAVTPTQAQMNLLSTLNQVGYGGIVPRRGIIMWSGTIAEIPSGWFLCDGQNGTPDLRDMFIMGAGGEYNPGDTGGAAEVTLTSAQMPNHAHTFEGTTVSSGAHSHTMNSAGAHTHNIRSDHSTSSPVTPRNARFGLLNDNPVVAPHVTNPAGEHTHTINSAGAHTHNFSGTTAEVGGGEAHENLPPFYALALIMKG
jgi:microcystin-dependent protein